MSRPHPARSGAPATRRSPDYTSATFETFERGAFSDTFERGTVALPPSGAAATAPFLLLLL